MPSPDLIVFETKQRCSICKETMPDMENLTLMVHVAKKHPVEFEASAAKTTQPESLALIAKVRQELAKEIKDKVVVVVSGGNVTNICAPSHLKVTIEMVDTDNLSAEGKSEAEIEAIIKANIKGLKIIY